MRQIVGRVAALGFALSSCGGAPADGSSSVAGAGAGVAASHAVSDVPGLTLERDIARATTKAVTVKTGGTLEIGGADGSAMRIAFSGGSLRHDQTLTAVPLSKPPIQARGVHLNGFLLEDANGKGPAMAGPAVVTFVTKQVLPPNTVIVRYRDDGLSFEMLQTVSEHTNGVTTLTASVDHFSAVGTAEPCESSGVGAATVGIDDWAYIITINDRSSFTNGPMTSAVSINMTTRSDRGRRGPYDATATSSTSNTMNSGGANVSAPSTTPIPSFRFTLTGTGAVFTGSGSLALTSRGTGTVTAGGRTASTALTNKSNVPYTITVTGNDAKLTITPTGVPPMTFRGRMAEDRSPKAFERVFQSKEHDVKVSEAAGSCIMPTGSAADETVWKAQRNDTRRWTSSPGGH